MFCIVLPLISTFQCCVMYRLGNCPNTDEALKWDSLLCATVLGPVSMYMYTLMMKPYIQGCRAMNNNNLQPQLVLWMDIASMH